MLWPLSEFNPTNTASKIIVTKSAITATNKMICPIAVFPKLFSFNVGTTTPKEIVEMIKVINIALSTNPSHTNSSDRA